MFPERLSGNIVIVGIGNPLRADDGAGPYLIQLLRKKVEDGCPQLRDVLLIDAGSVPENYLEQILAYVPEAIILADAAYMGERPGAYKLISDTLLPDTSLSTHQISLKVFVELLRGMCKAKIYVVGIQPQSAEYKEELSGDVRVGVEKLAEELAQCFGRGTVKEERTNA